MHAARERYNNACLLVFYCDFQQNSLSLCQYQTLWYWYCCNSLTHCVWGHWTGRADSGDSARSLCYPTADYGCLGERCKLPSPQRGLG